LYCGKCGAEIAEGAERCGECGEPATPSSATPISFGSDSTRLPRSSIAYAGFWLRAVAVLFDLLILTIITFPLVWRLLDENIGSQAVPHDYFAFYASGSRQAIAFQLLLQLICWLYFAAFESSVWQATPGKRMLGLYVTDLNGKRISFARATGRYIGKALEQVTLFIGFVMAGFTAKKQALHDMIAGCLVLRKKK
jgi:uncharacterized RDD family membrane protein YckC